jgi:halimadienyl-diphosphate synthase
MSVSPYDVAWVLRVADLLDHPVSPEALRSRLLSLQHADGSWGSALEITADRLLTTLTAIASLQLSNPRDARSQKALDTGCEYIATTLRPSAFAPKMPAFELLLPQAWDVAAAAGVEGLPPIPSDLLNARSARLALLESADLVFDPTSSIAHALEFLADPLQPGELDRAVQRNGSLGNSPSTSAWALTRTRAERRDLATYLRSVLDEWGAEIPYVTPFRTLDLAWNLLHADMVQLPDEITPALIVKELNRHRSGGGWAIDASVECPDGDSTAVCIYLMASRGQGVDQSELEPFIDEHRAVVNAYPIERTPSVSTIAHGLLALSATSMARSELVKRLVVNLVAMQRADGAWADKWHVSPYYATAHVIYSLCTIGAEVPGAREHATEWLLSTQDATGAWGAFGRPTSEETAYAVCSLYWSGAHVPGVREAIRKARPQLMTDVLASPAMWVGKVLYAPYGPISRIVEGASRIAELV